jgi:hypothetical protein
MHAMTTNGRDRQTDVQFHSVLTSTLMKVSGQLHALAAFPREETRVIIEYGAGLAIQYARPLLISERQ